MASFHSRYQQGEREQVWTELRNLQTAVREEPYFDDALAVAIETMQRVRRNIETLINRLKEIGYEFDERVKSPLSPPEKHPGLLSHTEDVIWTLGLSARAWIEVVGEVNLSGWPSNWVADDNATGHVTGPVYGNVLVVEFERREEFNENNVDRFCSDGHRIHVGDDFWFQFPGEEKLIVHRHEILVPDKTADATIDLQVKQMFFVDYLRDMFKWGGFPNFERFGYQPHDEPVLSLAKDLLPI